MEVDILFPVSLVCEFGSVASNRLPFCACYRLICNGPRRSDESFSGTAWLICICIGLDSFNIWISQSGQPLLGIFANPCSSSLG